jgi:hypothetical protein
VPGDEVDNLLQVYDDIAMLFHSLTFVILHEGIELPLLFGQTPSPENHAKLLFTTGIRSGLRSAYSIKI